MSTRKSKQSLEWQVGDILIFNSEDGVYKNVPVRVYRIQNDPYCPYHVRDLNYMSERVDNNKVNYGAMPSELRPLTKLDNILA